MRRSTELSTEPRHKPLMSKTLTFVITDNPQSAGYEVRGDVHGLTEKEAEQLVALLRSYNSIGRSLFKHTASLVRLFQELSETSSTLKGPRTYSDLITSVQKIHRHLQTFHANNPARVLEMLALFVDQTEEDFVKNLKELEDEPR
jgi:hypothetical protein